MENKNYLAKFYKSEINKDSLEKIFLDIDKSSNDINEEFIDTIAERFNNVYSSDSEVHLNPHSISNGTKDIFIMLYTNDRFTGNKYDKLKGFLTIEYLPTYNNTWLIRINNDFFKLAKSIYNYIGQDMIDHLLLELELSAESSNLISKYSNLYMILSLSSNRVNLPRYCKNLINDITHNKLKLHFYIHLFYQLRDLHDNFKLLLKIISQSALNNKIYFNSATIKESIDYYKRDGLTSDLLAEAYEYCFMEGFINKNDYKFVNKAIVEYSI